MSSQADKLRALIINIAVIANTLNRPLFRLERLLAETQNPENPGNDETVDSVLWTKAKDLSDRISQFKDACNKKY